MKNANSIRRLDDLGRLSIPKEIRRAMQWHDGDAIELSMGSDNTISLRKYWPLTTVLSEEADSLISAFKIAFGGEIIVSDYSGYIVASTERTYKEKVVDGMDAITATLITHEPVTTVRINGYENNVSGYFPIAYESHSFSKRCEGAVFVIGNVEAGQQMAKAIALALAEKLKDYI